MKGFSDYEMDLIEVALGYFGRMPRCKRTKNKKVMADVHALRAKIQERREEQLEDNLWANQPR